LDPYELKRHAYQLVTPGTRRVAIIAGCLAGVTGSLASGPLFFFLPAILILGAILQRWSPRPGRWLMWLGAVLLTQNFGGLCKVALESSQSLGFDQLIIRSLLILSVGLIWWCDVALVIGVYRTRHAGTLPDQEFPRAADWIVGVVAYLLTVWVVWSTLASLNPLPRGGNWAVLLLLVSCVAALDIAFALYISKMRRIRQ
jgi:hypothetical protein